MMQKCKAESELKQDLLDVKKPVHIQSQRLVECKFPRKLTPNEQSMLQKQASFYVCYTRCLFVLEGAVAKS